MDQLKNILAQVKKAWGFLKGVPAIVKKYLGHAMNVAGLVYVSVFLFLLVHGAFILQGLPACSYVQVPFTFLQCDAALSSRLPEFLFLYFTPLVLQLVPIIFTSLTNAATLPAETVALAATEAVLFAGVIAGALRMFGLTLHGLFTERGLDKRPYYMAIARAVIITGPTFALVVYRIFA